LSGLQTTRTLIWNPDQRFLFVNTVIQPGGFLQVAVLDVVSGAPSAGLALNVSQVGDSIGVGKCVPDDAPPFDSTRCGQRIMFCDATF